MFYRNSKGIEPTMEAKELYSFVSTAFNIMKSGEEHIKNLNNLISDNLSIGQKLLLPGESEETTLNTYTIKSGDTLYSISNKFGTTVDNIKKANNLVDNTLSINQILKIPTTQIVEIPTTTITYTVKPGDTLYSIANKYGITEILARILLNRNIIEKFIISIRILTKSMTFMQSVCL